MAHKPQYVKIAKHDLVLLQENLQSVLELMSLTKTARYIVQEVKTKIDEMLGESESIS
jgi:hypothetical protein